MPGDTPTPPLPAEASAPRRSYLWWGLGVFGVATAFAFSTFVMQLLGTIDRQDRQLRRTLDSLNAMAGPAAVGAEELARARTALRAVVDSRSEPMILAGTPHAPRAVGRLMRSAGPGMVVLLVSGLPRNEGTKYVLRFGQDAGGDSVGSFSVSDTTVQAFVFPASGLMPVRATITGGDPPEVILAGACRRQ